VLVGEKPAIVPYLSPPHWSSPPPLFPMPVPFCIRCILFLPPSLCIVDQGRVFPGLEHDSFFFSPFSLPLSALTGRPLLRVGYNHLHDRVGLFWRPSLPRLTLIACHLRLLRTRHSESSPRWSLLLSPSPLPFVVIGIARVSFGDFDFLFWGTTFAL